MDVIPSTIFVAFGVITAALLTGFFSYLNLVSAKENKVSEFRLAWVDGLREEIAIFTAAVRELVRVDGNNLYVKGDEDEKTAIQLKRERHTETREAYGKVVECLSKIQMRLNPSHIKEFPQGDEATLMANIQKTRQLFNDRRYREAGQFSDDIRDSATPILKKTWDLVKNGEPGYQKIRQTAARTIAIGTVLVLAMFVGFFIYALFQAHAGNRTATNLKTVEAQRPSLSLDAASHQPNSNSGLPSLPLTDHSPVGATTPELPDEKSKISAGDKKLAAPLPKTEPGKKE